MQAGVSKRERRGMKKTEKRRMIIHGKKIDKDTKMGCTQNENTLDGSNECHPPRKKEKAIRVFF
jgi:hypothetical protein